MQKVKIKLNKQTKKETVTRICPKIEKKQKQQRNATSQCNYIQTYTRKLMHKASHREMHCTRLETKNNKTKTKPVMSITVRTSINSSSSSVIETHGKPPHKETIE